MASLKLLITLVSIFGNVSGQEDVAQLLTARNAFNKINNGCYKFQYSQSCFCFTCSTQSMDIQVSNNEVQQVTFAEGNDFALNNFCSGNEEVFVSVLEISSRTIDDLFDLIEDAIDRDLPFDAIYHEKIGIPLSIFIDRVPGAIDDEVWYIINCVQFDMTCTCPAGKKMRDKMNKFNKKDDYSCSNIAIPECPVDRFVCNRFYDGCNTCSCEGKDTIGCTKKVCHDYSDGICLDCESNTQWNTCGNVRDPTCEETCGEPRCQCPDALPRWDGSACVIMEECTALPVIGR